MKGLILASIVTLVSTFAVANTADRLYPITSATNVKVYPLCPDGMRCITNGTVINMALTLKGCVDTLGPVTHRAEEIREKGVLKVFVSATGIANPRSMTARCSKMPTVNYKITLVNKYGDVKLKFLK